MDAEVLKALLWGILMGIISGGGTAVVGYLKGKSLESIEWDKAAGTVVLGMVVGGLAAYLGVPYDEAYQIVLTYGLVTALNQIGIALYRRFMDWWKSKYGAKPEPTPAPPAELPTDAPG